MFDTGSIALLGAIFAALLGLVLLPRAMRSWGDFGRRRRRRAEK